MHASVPPPTPTIELLLGPVIGHVGRTHAVVLLELNKTWVDDFSLDVVLVGQSSGGERSSDICTETMQTFKFERSLPQSCFRLFFDRLTPGTSYELKFPHWISPRPTRTCFTTLTASCTTNRVDQNGAALYDRVVVVSCNGDGAMRGYPDSRSLRDANWGAVRQCEPTLVCHIGDQVYMDSVVQDAVKQGLSLSTFEHYAREHYRKIWFRNSSALRELLSSTPNVMMRDDHEIDDNVADIQGSTRNATVCDYYTVLNRLYEEYQRALLPCTEPTDQSRERYGMEMITPGIWALYRPELTILFLDLRTQRSPASLFGSPEHLSLICQRLTTIHTQLLVLFQISPIFISRAWLHTLRLDAIRTQLYSRKMWKKEFEALANIFMNYQCVTQKKVTLVGGDIHIGQRATLVPTKLMQGTPIEYFTSSAITSPITKPRMLPRPIARLILKLLANYCFEVYDTFAITQLKQYLCYNFFCYNVAGGGTQTQFMLNYV